MAIIFTGVVYGHDVGMGEPCHQSGFQAKAFDEATVGGVPGRENLHCDFAIKVLLMCSIDTSHPSLAQWGQDSIVSKHCADQIILLHNSLQPLWCEGHFSRGQGTRKGHPYYGQTRLFAFMVGVPLAGTLLTLQKIEL